MREGFNFSQSGLMKALSGLALVLAVFFINPSARATPTNRWIEFVVSAKEKGLPISYLIGGLREVRDIYFDSRGNNRFYPMLNYLSFDSAIGVRDNIGSIEKIGHVHSGTVYHEVFHSFFHNVARPQRGNLYARFARRVVMSYQGKLAISIALGAHEEAWATYIGEVITGYLNTKQTIQRAVEQSRSTEDWNRRLEAAHRLWDRIIRQSPAAYYNPADSFSMYWKDVFKDVGVLIRNGYSQYTHERQQDKTIYIEDAIDDEDRRIIQREIFEGKIDADFSATFPESIKSPIIAAD